MRAYYASPDLRQPKGAAGRASGRVLLIHHWADTIADVLIEAIPQ